MNDYEPEAKFFKVLMHPARLAILNVLRNSEHCVCHIEAALGYRQAYISQQLAALREAGLVQDRRDGWNIYYRVAKPEVFAVIDAAQGVVADSRQRASRRHLTQSGRLDTCPCPHCKPVVENVAG